MVIPGKESGALPLVVLDKELYFLDLAFMDEKAYSKSLENGALWHYHGETGRVLPYEHAAYPGLSEPALREIRKDAAWYSARLEISAPPPAAPVQGQAPKAPGAAAGADPGVPRKAGPGGAALGKARPPLEESGSELDMGPYEVLARLGRTIASRRRELPEGSYTTHLFNSGPDKIKKKLGEEAVEVILASSKDDMIYEAADLVFHLLVLLESQDLSFLDILESLRIRE